MAHRDLLTCTALTSLIRLNIFVYLMRLSIWSRTNNKETREDTVEDVEDMVGKEVITLVEAIEEVVADVVEEDVVAEEEGLETWETNLPRGDHYND